VVSQRRCALSELLRTIEVPCHVALHPWAGKDTSKFAATCVDHHQDPVIVKPLDELIMLGADSATFTQLVSSQEPMYLLQDTVKASHHGYHQKLSCFIGSDPGKTVDASCGDQYWKRFRVLMNSVLTSTPVPGATWNSTSELLIPTITPKQASKQPISSQLAFTISTGRLTVARASKISVMFRVQAKLDTPKSVKVESDQVPGIKDGNKLSDVVLDTYGRAVLDTTGSGLMADIRTTLIGLKVMRDYVMKHRKEDPNPNGANGQQHSKDVLSHSPTNNDFFAVNTGAPIAFIRDVQPATNVPDFYMDGKACSIS
jgi:hypothetical protein